MPSYDLKCLKCGHTFEHHQKMADPNPPCPAPAPPEQQTCGGETIKTFASKKAGAVHFQGKGWAKDGYS